MSCKKDSNWEAAEVKDIHIEPAAITAYVTASFDYGEKHELFFEYSEYDDMMYAHRYPMVTDGGGKYHTTVYNLEGLSTYYCRFMARSKYGTKETEIATFTTVELFVPTIVTKPVNSITVFSGLSGGTITSDGGAPVKKRGVCWGTEPQPTLNDSVVPFPQDVTNFTSLISGLEPATTYYVRAYATNKAGTAYGQEESFTTRMTQLPTVATCNVQSISYTWAIGGGDVTDDGGLLVSERGICWSEHPNPTLDDSHGIMGVGPGEFHYAIGNLFPGITYHVRAYAVNPLGMVYGEDVSFSTKEVPDTPEGALPGMFTIANRRQAWFSQGNLQYRAIDSLWRFAEQQYDMMGSENDSIGAWNENWIDLFGWGTSGWSGTNALCYQPYSFYKDEAYYFHSSDLLDDYAQADWGVFNPISNGGNEPGLWRTMTQLEWQYLLGVRNTLDGIRFAKATVNGVQGLLIPPDDWRNDTYPLNNPNTHNAHYDSNVIDLSQWGTLEEAGMLFLPAAGQRIYTTTTAVNHLGFYWSSSKGAYCLSFTNYSMKPDDIASEHLGKSVRLIRLLP